MLIRNGLAWAGSSLQVCLELGVDAIFDKSNEIDALLDYFMEMQ